MSKAFIQKLAKIQQELSAPKNQFNSFGNYNYRSCEDIQEAVKPLLGDLFLSLSDEVVLIGDRFYVKATATITDGEEKESKSALAREPITKKGMDDSQITGTASSYARKYALNGLFLIDDAKDPDTDEHTNQQRAGQQQRHQQQQQQRSNQQRQPNQQRGQQQPQRGGQQQRQQNTNNRRQPPVDNRSPQEILNAFTVYAESATLPQLSRAWTAANRSLQGKPEHVKAKDVFQIRKSELESTQYA